MTLYTGNTAVVFLQSLRLWSVYTARRYMLLRYMLSPCVCPSVCHKPVVSKRLTVNRIMTTLPYGS